MSDAHLPTLSPDIFIERWSASELKESSAAQSHFNDLCALLGEPKPTDIDPKGEFYCFERGAKKEGGGDGAGDDEKRGHYSRRHVAGSGAADGHARGLARQGAGAD